MAPFTINKEDPTFYREQPKIKRIQLWNGTNVETHGGENNAAARRIFCPRTGKYADRAGCSILSDAKSFGTFHSGHGDDPVIGGGSSGSIIDFDYISGMPDLRYQHLHIIDNDGYDRMMVYYAAECTLYDGLQWRSQADHGVSVTKYFGDFLHVMAVGVPIVRPNGPEYINFPVPVLRRTGRTTGGEGGANGLRAFRTNPNTTTDRDNLPVAFGNTLWTLASGTGWNLPGANHTWTDLGEGSEFPRAARSPNPHGNHREQRGQYSGILQYGKFQSLSNQTIDVANSTMPSANDVYGCTIHVGYSHRALVAAVSTSFTSSKNIYDMNLKITGLERVILSIGSGAMTWNTATGLESSGSGSPSGAPRQLINGQIWAILSKD